MELETINKLFLELSQVATATTAKEIRILNALKNANDVCRSMHEISKRKGVETGWDAFANRLHEVLLEQHHILHPEQYAR